MTEILHIEPTTITDLSAVAFGKNHHSKLAHSATEFFLDRCKGAKRIGNDLRVLQPDIATLREFVDYLISEKGYN